VAKRTFIVILNEVKDLASSGAEKMLDASLSLSMTEPTGENEHSDHS
jgi:hypothetical protein